ncbi:enolase-phosphatase E1 [Neodiprion lecontei]|uniref:Enolase-phosphatase E1 n=1 Tax=Neodiprion lecontei TaxID=441921 RepID=A0A6J0BYM6_NEOLC|nr:enolase-phosphatase E1 [Neodiprion lecontei]
MAGEKRSQDQEESLLKQNVIIVDIEGTTTSITFVKETLFPYIRENVKKYIDAKWEEEEFKRDLEKLKEQAKKDEEDKIEGLVAITGSTTDEEKESVVKNILWQMDGDRKTGALKQLQGHMWREAYDSGNVKGHVYEDVPECLKAWKISGKKVYIYSSGSVEAQKLLFGHSQCGDLLEYFSGHFDTGVGMKQEATSYKNILDQVKSEASDVIFLTDIVQEAKAAKEAGLYSILMIREGNAPLSAEEKMEFRTATSFLDLSFESAAKRQKLDTPEIDKKESIAKPTAEERMEISGDVEMTDVSEKENESKVESEDAKREEKEEKKGEKETNEIEGKKNTDVEATVSVTTVEKDEAMETDGKPEVVKQIDESGSDAKPVEEKKEEKVEVVESEKGTLKVSKDDDKSKGICETIDKESSKKSEEKTLEKNNADEADRTTLTDSQKTELLEKKVELSEEKSDSIITETNSKAVNESTELSASRKPDETPTKISDDVKEIKTEGSEESCEILNNKLGIETEKSEMESKPAVEETHVKVDVPLTKETVKSDAKIESMAAETEKTDIQTSKVLKANEESALKSDQTVAKDVVKENGMAKTEEPSKTDDQNVAVENKDSSDAVKKTESKVEETVANSMKETESNSKDAIKAETSIVAEAKKETVTKDVDVEEEENKELKKEGAKSQEEPTTDANKTNGTTQNGETVTEDENKKIHTNGVNEACSSVSAEVKTNKDMSSQKREPESSTDASAESIKVKKVVDSTVADGAGEPDVSPTVVVAATS